MINVSNEFRQHMYEDKRDFLGFADITLKDGTVLKIDNTDIWSGSFKIDDGTSSPGIFSIGSAVINKFTVTINNIYDKYSEYDFGGAIVTAYVGLQLSSTLEKIRKGTYIVDDPQYDGSTITLECLDYMTKFERDYSDVKTKYPATLEEITRDICSVCGVTLMTTTFDNGKYTVRERPDDEAMTCRQILSYCVQIACKFARFDAYGRLVLGWYAQDDIEAVKGFDGGMFDSKEPLYGTGDKLDGGNFTNYSSGDTAMGGTFEDSKKYHHLYSLSNMTVATDDIIVTGFEVTEEFTETEEKKKGTYLYGKEGYVLSLPRNKFIQHGQGASVAEYIGKILVGFRFRPLSVSVLGDPSIEAGDWGYVTDRKGNSYTALFSNVAFTIGGFSQIDCDAETPSKNSSVQYSELEQAMVQSRKETEQRISDYDLAVQQLTNLLTQSFGVFKSVEELEDGSTIFYLHNKPKREESMTIWKMTADAFGVSTDGGKTWNAGMDSSGNAVVNVLSAIGINFDWARGGTLTLGGGSNGNGVCKVVDANGNVIVTLNNDGITATKGTFGGSLNAAKGTFEGVLDAGEVIGSTITGGAITGSKIKSDGETSFTEISEGRLKGGQKGKNETGYIGFNSYYTSTGVWGTRIGGKGIIALYTPYLGVGSYTKPSDDGTVTMGQSGSITVTTTSGSTKTLTFKNGLMVTAI